MGAVVAVVKLVHFPTESVLPFILAHYYAHTECIRLATACPHGGGGSRHATPKSLVKALAVVEKQTGAALVTVVMW